MVRVRIVCPARVHFGLIEICPGESNLYGGMGVTVDEPSTTIDLCGTRAAMEFPSRILLRGAPELADRLINVVKRSFEGPVIYSDSRIETVSSHSDSTELSLSIVGHPEQHSGMGSGTQLACGVATLLRAATLLARDAICLKQFTSLEVWKSQSNFTAQSDDASTLARLAERSGRGKRSNIGLSAHLWGGLFVDQGVDAGSAKTRQVERFNARSDWPVVLVTPGVGESITGDREVSYFQKCAAPNPNRMKMWELIRQRIVPSQARCDFDDFASAIYEYGKMAGEIFRPVQSGIYRDSVIAAIVDKLQSSGASCVGQSSWGPTVFAIVQSDEESDRLVRHLQQWCDSTTEVRATRMTNSGASLTVFDDEAN
jgi:predicted sugar kinase